MTNYTAEQLGQAADKAVQIAKATVESLEKFFPDMTIHPEVLGATIIATTFELSLMMTNNYTMSMPDPNNPDAIIDVTVKSVP
jgi:D-arabinose 5-phosphate isomerase GutQ